MSTSLDQKALMYALSRAADHYDAAALVQNEVACRLEQRLELMRINPKIILDLGSRTGLGSRMLEKRYKKAAIISTDMAYEMLRKNKAHKKWLSRQQFICARCEHLPFADHSIDLIFSNLMLHGCDLESTIRELQRLLRPGGLFLFSMFGPDTFKELRHSWQGVDGYPHVHTFSDMHDVGDILLREKLVDPVMDMEYLTVTYQNLNVFLRDLKAQGMHNVLQNRAKGLMGKLHFQTFLKNYEHYRNSDGKLPVTHEIIYGHAWGSVAATHDDHDGEVSIPIASIKRRR